MYDFEALIGELLQNRPELSRDEVMRRIEDKKRTVGAGYLTDQGALFLVAGELGVSLRKEDASSDMTIKDLYIGANDVTVVARVLALYPVATYNKKDGGTGKYRRVVLFDGKNSARLTVWEEGIEQTGKLGLGVDSLVRVANAYVKQGLDGKPNLNLGKRGRIELLTDEKIAAKVPSLSTVTEKLPSLTKEEPFVAIEAVVSSEPRYSEFVRSDGSPGSLFQFGVARDGGKETRVVIWSPEAQPELKPGQKIRVTNVRSRRSNSGGFEIHGDAGSVISMGPPPERIELRVAATSSSSSAKVVLGVGKDRRVKFIELGKDVDEPVQGDVVGVTPDQTTEASGGQRRGRADHGRSHSLVPWERRRRPSEGRHHGEKGGAGRRGRYWREQARCMERFGWEGLRDPARRTASRRRRRLQVHEVGRMGPATFEFQRDRETARPQLGLSAPEGLVFVDEHYHKPDDEQRYQSGADETVVALHCKEGEVQSRAGETGIS
jgi:ssDNA-binding replication factor A large subunit